MQRRTEGRACRLMAVVAVLALAGCASSGRKAPVEDRSKASKPPAVAAVPAPAPAPVPAPATEPAAKPLPGIENAGKPGYYTVKPGDTVVRIALDNGQNWRDVARWNNLDNPNLVEVGQVLRVVPPATDPTVATTRAVPSTGRVDTRPLDGRPAGAAPAPGAASSADSVTASPAPPAASGLESGLMARQVEAFVGTSRPAVPPLPGTEVGSVAEFVCEEDVRQAVKLGRTIVVGERTIITPAARDLAAAHRVFVSASWPR